MEENDVSWLSLNRQRALDWILFEQSIAAAHRSGYLAKLLRARIDAQAAHCVIGWTDMDDPCQHGVEFGWEVAPILVHGEWRALLGWLLEELGVV